MKHHHLFHVSVVVAWFCMTNPSWATQTQNPEVTGVQLKVENGLTNCMEKRNLTFTAKSSVTWHNGGPYDIIYKLHIKGPTGGFKVTDEDWTMNQTCVFDEYQAPKVPRTAGTKSYTLQAYATAQDEPKRYAEMTSVSLDIDVRRLWIDEFKDTGTSKDWKVVVGRDITYKAFTSDDCTKWNWDMEDGIPDAWNPTGGDKKEGTTMRIPLADLDRAGKNWFGEAYGTVTVTCKDGEGNSFALDSDDMEGNKKKAKVFFPAMHLVKNKPCWYLFWKNGAVPGLDNSVIFENKASYGASEFTPGIIWDTERVWVYNFGGGRPVAPTGSHYLAPIVAGGRSFGGPAITGIDCCAEVIAHEQKHNSNAKRIAAGAADTDQDGCPDADEAALGCVIGNKDTHNLAGLKAPVYAAYGDDEYSAMNAANGKKGVVNLDWSYEGKQW